MAPTLPLPAGNRIMKSLNVVILCPVFHTILRMLVENLVLDQLIIPE